MKPLPPRARLVLAGLAVGTVLALVFLAWTRPHFAVELANFVASCF